MDDVILRAEELIADLAYKRNRDAMDRLVRFMFGGSRYHNAMQEGLCFVIMQIGKFHLDKGETGPETPEERLWLEEKCAKIVAFGECCNLFEAIGCPWEGTVDRALTRVIVEAAKTSLVKSGWEL